MGAIHHFIPTLLPGDGSGNAARAMQHRLVELGAESLIFVQEDKADLGLPTFDSYPGYANKDDILMYHLATSSAIPSYLRTLRQDVVVNYQNLTPPNYFRPYNAVAAAFQDRGMAELRLLADQAVMGIAPSMFNLKDMINAGFSVVEQSPIILDPSDFMGAGDAQASKMLYDLSDKGFSNWLFVGRLVPNKAQEHLIMALAAHREIYGDTAVLHLVGRPTYYGYTKALYELTKSLDLLDRVNFVMGVSPAELAAFYTMSDIFISTSEHEGFCMPIVEALFHGLSVIAYDAGAVPETLGIGGIHLDDRDPITIASWANRIMNSSELRNNLAELAAARTNQLSPRSTIARFDEVVARLLKLTNRDWSLDFDQPSSLVRNYDEFGARFQATGQHS